METPASSISTAAPASQAERGVLYVATGEAHRAEAVISARSVKRHMPGMPITLATDAAVTLEPFDRVVPLAFDRYDRSVNIRAMMLLPYDRTLVLDSDTYVCGDLSSLFDVLDRFDFAAVPEATLPAFDPDRVPPSFPHFNGGVLAMARNDRVKAFLEAWLRCYERHCAIGNAVLETGGGRRKKFMRKQPALRTTLYCSDLHFTALRAECNCRLELVNVVVGDVKILHGQHPDFERLSTLVNADRGSRSFFMCGTRCIVRPYRWERMLARWGQTWRKRFRQS